MDNHTGIEIGSFIAGFIICGVLQSSCERSKRSDIVSKMPSPDNPAQIVRWYRDFAVDFFGYGQDDREFYGEIER